MYIADMHCDSIMKIWLARREGKELALRDSSEGCEEMQIDVAKLLKGGYLMQNFAMYVDYQMEDGTDPWTQYQGMVETYKTEIKANADVIREAFTYEDIIENRDAGLISAVMTVEEGGVLQGDLDRLKVLHDDGARMMTLTWNYENELAYPNDLPEGMDEDYTKYFRFVPRTDNGLKAKGFEAVEIMQELGILVDVSHLSDAGFYDVAKTCKGPFVASHSNARVISGCNRNMTDDMIRTVGEHGGVIGVNFCPEFLEEGPSEAECKSTIAGIAKHARHMITVGGLEAVGLGTDYDGLGECYLEIADASQMQKLVSGLEAHGFTANEIESICYRNVLNLYKEVMPRRTNA